MDLLEIITSICDGMEYESIKELDAENECWYVFFILLW
ncbi:hypothetical protein T4A_755 [Trichinella pseudospiralis]|uniref:Uncharacterized protein n=1 Tax=Trichinella pseudospiralis TaxID=6337 RepID=A0A0V1DR79_TRIPS|nr:hypothetical protein T4A_755 [Trichinella pseudospiralis]